MMVYNHAFEDRHHPDAAENTSFAIRLRKLQKIMLLN